MWKSNVIALLFLLLSKYCSALECLDPENTDFCVAKGYNKNKQPPDPPLNVSMPKHVQKMQEIIVPLRNDYLNTQKFGFISLHTLSEVICEPIREVGGDLPAGDPTPH